MKDDFVTALSNPARPVPGGGSAAAHAGCVGLSLLKKIVGIEMNRRQAVSELFSWRDLMGQVSALDESLTRLRDEDGKTYMRLAEVKAEGNSETEIASALRHAIDCPLGIMKQACRAFNCVSQTAKHCKRHLLSDLQVVCELLVSAIRGAYHISRSNLTLIADQTLKDDYQKKIEGSYERCCEALKLAESSILLRISKT